MNSDVDVGILSTVVDYHIVICRKTKLGFFWQNMDSKGIGVPNAAFVLDEEIPRKFSIPRVPQKATSSTPVKDQVNTSFEV